MLALSAIFAPSALAEKRLTADDKTLRRCTISVLRRECFSDLQSRYLDDPEAGPCTKFTCGQEFTVASAQCPEGFCPKAWACISAHVEAVLANANDTCGESTADHAIIACCSDGTRPVVFKITPA